MTLFRIFNTKDNLCKRKFLRITFALSLFFFFGLLASVISSTSPGFFTSSALAATGEFSSAPTLVEADYPTYFGLSSRVIVWILAQLHLFFAAFVLAVPIFVVILEALGMFTKDKRYDKTAFEFLKVCLTAYSVTAFIGGLLAISLMVLYPDLMDYLFSIFGSTILFYAFIFFAETATLYIYYYGWRRMVGGKKKWLHLGVGLLLNSFGTGLMFVANAWVTFMMSPEGVDLAGTFDGNVWHAINNHLWNPINLHRFIANLAYGGSIVGAYAAYKFLGSSTDEERGHYDWMGYTANFIAICALLPLPFAGYWLTAEIYAFSQQMGITLMGGFFAWIFIVQAVLIGALFLAANYYLWCAMERSKGSERFTPYIKYIGFVLVLAFLVWFTPHTLIQKPWEMGANQGGYHPLLSPLGLMPAKNIAVNIMILATFLSFLLYRRVNILPTVKWAKKGTSVQVALFTAGVLNIVILGIYYGY
ncbi:MAG: cytochrome ubiquinol oxidase subunit I, partial [Deltaproteobacteria bacterium]|nr:cytochrome ubiquinol oxidase subunit I [Deltaproteobacteria bacterium]